jgi:multiple sugar transport system permease protein
MIMKLNERKKYNNGINPVRLVLHLIMILYSLVLLLPLLWAISTSLKSIEQVFLWPPKLIPIPIMWENYPIAFTKMPFLRYFLNTVIISVGTVLGTCLSTSFVAYGFGRMKFPGRDVLFIVLLSTMMMPQPVTFIPLFIIYNKLGWINTYLPLILPSFFGLGAVYIFLLRQYYRNIPQAISDAAKIDGCNEYRIWWSIIIPSSVPVLMVVMILSFQGSWNDFFQPLLYINKPILRTLALGLYQFQGMPGEVTFYNYLMAIAMLMIMPMLTVFIVFQKYFLRGIVISGVKG